MVSVICRERNRKTPSRTPHRDNRRTHDYDVMLKNRQFPSNEAKIKESYHLRAAVEPGFVTNFRVLAGFRADMPAKYVLLLETLFILMLQTFWAVGCSNAYL